MTSRIGARILFTAFLLPLTATAKPPASSQISEANASVVVIRGGQERVESGLWKVGEVSQAADSVIVMRPVPGSFMRDTSRLAAEAADREEQAARDDARAASTRLAEAMWAIGAAVRAGQSQPEKDRHDVILLVGDELRVPRAPGNQSSRPVVRAP